MVNLPLKQHSCLWGCRARDKHWVQRDCKKTVDVKNVVNIPLVQREINVSHHFILNRDE